MGEPQEKSRECFSWSPPAWKTEVPKLAKLPSWATTNSRKKVPQSDEPARLAADSLARQTSPDNPGSPHYPGSPGSNSPRGSVVSTQGELATAALKTKVESALRCRTDAAQDAAREAMAKVEAKQVQLEAMFARMERIGSSKESGRDTPTSGMRSPPDVLPSPRDVAWAPQVSPSVSESQGQEQTTLAKKLAETELRLQRADKERTELQCKLESATVRLVHVEQERSKLEALAYPSMREGVQKPDAAAENSIGLDNSMTLSQVLEERDILLCRLGELHCQLDSERQTSRQQVESLRRERAEVEEKLAAENGRLRREVAGYQLEQEVLRRRALAAEALAAEVRKTLQHQPAAVAASTRRPSAESVALAERTEHSARVDYVAMPESPGVVAQRAAAESLAKECSAMEQMVLTESPSSGPPVAERVEEKHPIVAVLEGPPLRRSPLEQPAPEHQPTADRQAGSGSRSSPAGSPPQVSSELLKVSSKTSLRQRQPESPPAASRELRKVSSKGSLRSRDPESPPPVSRELRTVSGKTSLRTCEPETERPLSTSTRETRSSPNAGQEMPRRGNAKFTFRKSEPETAASPKVSEPELVTPAWPLITSPENEAQEVTEIAQQLGSVIIQGVKTASQKNSLALNRSRGLQDQESESATPVWPKIRPSESDEDRPFLGARRGLRAGSPGATNRSPRMRALLKCSERRLRSPSPG